MDAITAIENAIGLLNQSDVRHLISSKLGEMSYLNATIKEGHAAIEAVRDLQEASMACIEDLKRYTPKCGPGPDRRMLALIAAVFKVKGGAK